MERAQIFGSVRLLHSARPFPSWEVSLAHIISPGPKYRSIKVQDNFRNLSSPSYFRMDFDMLTIGGRAPFFVSGGSHLKMV